MIPACGNCRFSNTGFMNVDGVPSSPVLVCRRFPPTMTMIYTPDGYRPISNVPPVLETDWCGEHEPKP